MKTILTFLSSTAVAIALFNAYRVQPHQQTEKLLTKAIDFEQHKVLQDRHTMPQKDTIAGIVKGYNVRSTVGCLYVDQQMVSAGVAKALGDKQNKALCKDPKYGIGAPVSFKNLDQNTVYTTIPDEEVLISMVGQWEIKSYAGQGRLPIFYVKSYEPFF